MIYHKIRKINKRGFSLAEVLMFMVITCVIIAVSLPILTKSKIATLQKNGIDVNTLNCITSTSTSSASCTAVLSAAKYGDPNVINTLQYYINYGSSTTFALQMMRLSCDNLSTKACDYFINSCAGDTSANQTQYCNISGSNYDLYYYLTSTLGTSSTTNPNFYIANQVNSLCSQGIPAISSAVANACTSISTSLSCSLSSCVTPCTCPYTSTANQVNSIYNQLQTATAAIAAAHSGSLSGLCSGDTCLRNLYLPYFTNTSMTCTDSNAAGNCWASSDYDFNGNSDNSMANYASFVLTNGIVINFVMESMYCQQSDGYLNNECAQINVDLTGLNGPNTVGKDIFGFDVLSNSILPNGTLVNGGDGNSGDCIPGSNASYNYGWSCSQQMINLANNQTNVFCNANGCPYTSTSSGSGTCSGSGVTGSNPYTVSGSGVTVSCSGSGSIIINVTATGGNASITLNGGDVSINVSGAGSSVTVNGSAYSISGNVSGAGSSLTGSPSASNVSCSASGAGSSCNL